ncbi:MAG: helix-turn-helix domain-containing protein [Bacteroidales bacterium]
MNYIFLIASFHAFFFSVLLYQKKRKSIHGSILFWWIIYLGIFTGIYGIFHDTLFTRFHLLSAAFISLLMLHGPFLYLYVSSLVTDNPKFNSRILLHFIPFILFNFYLLIASFIPSASEGIRLDHMESLHSPPLLFLMFLFLTAISGPVYIIRCMSLFKTLDINIFNNFSSSEKINPGWLRKLVYIFGLVWTLLMAAAITHHAFHLFSWTFCTDGIALALSIFIILIGYFGLKQNEIFSAEKGESFVTYQRQDKYAGSSMKDQDAMIYRDKLEKFMKTEKPYLNPDLSLPLLATALNIPSHHLSRVINEKFGMNFFDFINHYRVEAVKSRLLDPGFDHYTTLGIAYESGFNSKSAFNRVFKKISGVTPGVYKKTMSA